jgi:hypothetical protein
MKQAPEISIATITINNGRRMYSDMQTPQVVYPPLSIPSVSPPPPLYTPPNPQTFLELLRDLFALFLHAILRPFSTRLVPCHPSNPNGIDLFPAPPPVGQAIVPVRRERRGRSKSPSASPSSQTLTEGTYDGEQRRRTTVEKSGFDVRRVKIRGGRSKVGVPSNLENWAKEAFKM